MNHNFEGAIFHKSTRSGQSGDCVEVATNLPDIVAVRDTKDRTGPVLAFSGAEWTAFLEGVKAGEFDL